MTVTKVGGMNMIAHAQWPLCPPFPRVAVFYVTTVPDVIYFTSLVTRKPQNMIKQLLTIILLNNDGDIYH